MITPKNKFLKSSGVFRKVLPDSNFILYPYGSVDSYFAVNEICEPESISVTYVVDGIDIIFSSSIKIRGWLLNRIGEVLRLSGSTIISLDQRTLYFESHVSGTGLPFLKNLACPSKITLYKPGGVFSYTSNEINLELPSV